MSCSCNNGIQPLGRQIVPNAERRRSCRPTPCIVTNPYCYRPSYYPTFYRPQRIHTPEFSTEGVVAAIAIITIIGIAVLALGSSTSDYSTSTSDHSSSWSNSARCGRWNWNCNCETRSYFGQLQHRNCVPA